MKETYSVLFSKEKNQLTAILIHLKLYYNQKLLSYLILLRNVNKNHQQSIL